MGNSAQYDSTGIENTVIIFDANKAITDVVILIVAVVFMVLVFNLVDRYMKINKP